MRRGATARRLCLTALATGFACAGSASAESSVTLYGIADVGAAHTRYTFDRAGNDVSASRNGMRSSGLSTSRWGFKGSEDMGGGLKAVFRLEGRINLNDGSTKKGKIFDRLAYVGLAGAWGTFTMGRQKDIGDSFHDLDVGNSLGKAERAFGGQGGRRDSLFKYLTPRFAGAQGGLAFSSEPGKSGGRDNFYSAGVRYEAGPVHLVGTYDYDRRHANRYAVKNWMVGGTYDFKVVAISAAYGQDRNGKINRPGDVDDETLGGFVPTGLGAYNQAGFKSNNYLLEAAAPLGVGKLSAVWMHSTSNLGSVYATANAGAGLGTRSQDIYAAVYAYPLSKRTRLYAYGAYAGGLAYLDGFSGRELGVGLQHRF